MRDILDPQDRWLGTPGGFVLFGNKAPVAIDDTLSVVRDSGAVSVAVLANDFDPEGQPLTLVSASASLGTAVAEADNTVTYTPPPGISGFDTVVYEVADDENQRRTAQINVTITPPVLQAFTLLDNTLAIEAEDQLLDLTITQPGDRADTYQVDVAGLSGGPLNLMAPGVSGDFTIAQTLTAQDGLWVYDRDEGPPVQSWQWRLNGADIAGATEATYTVQPGDTGQVLTVAEIQTDTAGQREASATVPVSQAFQPGVDAGLLGWWDASDTTTITADANALSLWADKAGGGDLVQSNPPFKPMSGTRTLNGLNVVDFSGGNFVADASRTLPVSGDVALHMAVVIDNVTNAYEALVSMDASNDFQLDSANETQFTGQLNAAGIGNPTALSGGPFAGGLIVSLMFDRTGSATAEVFVANTSRGAMGYTTALDSSVALILMANRANNARLDGAVAEVALTSSLNNRADYHAYLAAKWGLT